MAIFELDAEGDATRIYGSTFYENSAGANGGGAIVLVRAPLELKNSIVANNTFLNGLSSNILNEVGQGTVQITSLGYNFIGDSTNSLLSFLDSDILGSNVNPLDPMLDTLGFYGGPTLVHPPLAGSTVRGVGEPIESTDLLTDQRGFSRKRGSREGNIDIGAFEAQSSFISPIARALCVEEPEFLPLQAILIQDSTGGAFENGENLSLEYAAPDGLEFQVGQGTVNCLGSGLSDCNINVSSDLITITYTRSYDTLLNSIEIRDIFIKAESGTDPTFAELIRTGGNALQYDNEVGDAVNIASVSILPTVKLADLPYDDSFESNQSFWIPSGDSSIWEVGSPQGEIIDRAASGQNVWMTDLDGSYSTLDTSWVASSCFDFRGLSNPLLSVSIWSDTESGFDGTVFQQSLDGGDSWQTVGTNERGINWYNSATISANPGKQTTQEEYGWTGRDTAWRRAFVKLDQVDDQDAVRFRFAFASIGQIDETQSNNGFAFDDFFIGESDTRVLMEHFTDDSPVRNVANEEVQGLVSSFSPNVIPIQYHITAGDEFYERNKAGPRVRGLYYGVSEAGNAVVNGNEFLGLSRELDAGVLERSLLKTSSISVGLDTLEDEAIKILPSRDIPEEAVLYVAVVENTEEQEAVFRAFLPNAGGVLLNDPQAGVLQSFNISWDETTSASTSILDNYDSLEVVVFVQNRETKEVYQSISSPIWSGLLERNALREGLFNDPEAKLSFYPNPVHEYIFLDFGKINQERLQLSISDLQGKSVFQQLIKPGLSLYELNLAQLSRGMYFLHLTKEGESVRKEKIILR
ncbi:MAG: T9SS type A sorting domain-containing protein [Bacteroidota bacterium]